MMHDDVDEDGLQKYHKEGQGRWKPGRLVVESSPGNYQVWVKGDRPLSRDEKKYWLEKMGSDPGASPLHRWGRCPGLRNHKDKYETDKGWPLVRLFWVDWAKQASIPAVEIDKEKETKSVPPTGVGRKNRSAAAGLPSQNISRADYYKGVDQKGKVRESEQDFAYALALLHRGVQRYEAEERIRNERTDWENHKGEKRIQHYLKRTLDGAEAIINNSSYRITVKNTARNIERSETVNDVPKPKAKQLLGQKAKAMAVQMGFDSANNVQIKIEKIDPVKKTKKA